MRFYATIDADSLPRTVHRYIPAMVAYLLPASSWARKRKRHTDPLPVPNLPFHLTNLAADCGGFVATFRWGDYQYTPEQYVDWLSCWSQPPLWTAMMDFCCEPEVAENTGVVRLRQDRTTQMAYLFWQEYRDVPWVWVPTIQGWEVADYQRHARELAPLIREMQAHYGPQSAFRVGIGTLCRRASTTMIHQVVRAVAAELPTVPLHLWGIKLGALQSSMGLPASVVSVDSAAWNGCFGAGNETWRSSGMRRNEWRYRVALPEYVSKVELALSHPKQPLLI